MSSNSYRSHRIGSAVLWPQSLTAEAARITDRFAPPGCRSPQRPADQLPDRQSDVQPPRLVLCSRSPRRQNLLALCGRPFETAAADLPEKALEAAVVEACGRLPIRLSAAMANRALAIAKARTVHNAEQAVRSAGAAHESDAVLNPAASNPAATAAGALYIGSDTMVLTEDAILDKPADSEEARRMLLALSGRTHYVLTAVCLLRTDANGCTRSEQTHTAATAVTFYPPDRRQKELIDWYAASGSPLDKAGGYGIQDAGALLIERISGDYYTVMGLPVAWLNRELMLLGAPDRTVPV